VIRSISVCLSLSLLACDSTDADSTESASSAIEHLQSLHAGELTVTRTATDALSMSHTRIQQTLDGVPVFGGEAIVHLSADGGLRGITDNLITAPSDLDTTPRITEEDAIQSAVASSLGWMGLTEMPESELVILPRDGRIRVAWKVQLSRLDGSAETARPVIFIDAVTGEELWRFDNFQTGSVSGSGTSSYSGTVDLETYAYSGEYYLEDPDRGLGTYTFENSKEDLYYLIDDDNQWESEASREGVDVHYAGAGALDFYAEVFDRDGIDGSGGPGALDAIDGSGAMMAMLVNYGEGYVNAGWTGTVMLFGDGDGYYSSALTTVDVVGHEMTHGVVEFEAGLIYADESGALNESYADIMGMMIERYMEGEHSGTWMMAEDCFTPGVSGDAMRYFDDPTADGISSDHYTSRYTGSEDDGGVHLNSGIGNLAFYLTAEGGAHPRRGGNMVGIGIDAAGDIWYRGLTRYMTASTDFGDAREALLYAAEDLYGDTSDEYAAVQNAWHMVGIGDAAPEAEEIEEEETPEEEETEETAPDGDTGDTGDTGDGGGNAPDESKSSAGCATVTAAPSWAGILAVLLLGWRRRNA
jgi:Zn-dependent metalloprotease